MMLTKKELKELFADISKNSAVGIDVKNEDDFIEVQNEIQKLSSVSGIKSIDFSKIKNISQSILSKKSKNLNVACYLSFSLAQNGGNELIQAVEILAKFIDKFWDNAFPPVKRTRARVNVISWWADKIENRLNANDLNFNVSQKNKLTAAISNIDKIFKNKLQDDYSFDMLRLKRILKAKAKIKGKVISLGSDGAESKLGHDNSSTVRTNTPKELTSNSVADTSKETLERLSIKEIKELCADSLKNTKQLLGCLLDRGVYSSDLFIINRLMIWENVKTAPPNDKKVTMIVEPEEHQTKYLQGLFQEQKWEELLKESERLTTQHIFWIDLHYYVIQALQQLDKKEEERTVKFMLINFLEKAKGVQNYKFRDKKTPFASKETISWLKKINQKDTKKDKKDKTMNVIKDSVPPLSIKVDVDMSDLVFHLKKMYN